MKNEEGRMDLNPIGALCDRHAPSDWYREQGVGGALLEAKEFYRRTMKGRRWADSRESALSLLDLQQEAGQSKSDEEEKGEDEFGDQVSPEPLTVVLPNQVMD
jgi:NuA3 HAT complex component NTO1